MIKELIYDNYLLNYEVKNNYIIITKIEITNNLNNDIKLPDMIDNLPVEEIVLNNKINPNRFRLRGKFILPSTIKYSFLGEVAYDNIDKYFTKDYPTDLIYNHGFKFEGDLPNNILYSTRGNRLSNSFNFDTIRKEDYYDIKHNLKYYKKLSSNCVSYVFQNNVESFFTCFEYCCNYFLFKCYLHDDKAYIYQILYDKDYSKSKVLVIPDDVCYEGKTYPLVGICSEACYFKYEKSITGSFIYIDVNTIIMGKNIEYLGINALISNVDIYLNDKITFFGGHYHNITIYSSKKLNHHLTLFGFKKDWKTNISDLNIRYLQVPECNHELKDIDIDGFEKLEYLNKYQESDENEIIQTGLNNQKDYIFHDNGIYEKIDDNTVSLRYLPIKTKQSEIIIPDNIICQDTLYEVTSICNSAIECSNVVQRLVIGKNIETIGYFAVRISKCYDLEFLGRKIKSIEDYGLSINLNTDKLLIPNSIIYLGSYFSCGTISEVVFENDSNLLILDEYCFEEFGFIMKMVLPKNIMIVNHQALRWVKEITFESEDLNLREFRSDILNPKIYQFGEYIGTTNNPYLVCIHSDGYIIHEKCLFVFNALNVMFVSPKAYLYDVELVDRNNIDKIRLNNNLLVNSNKITENINLCKCLNKEYIKNNLQNKTTYYLGCYYLEIDNNPYAVLYDTLSDLSVITVHEDTEMIMPGALSNCTYIRSLTCLGDKIFYIGSNVIPIEYLEIGNYLLYLEQYNSILKSNNKIINNLKYIKHNDFRRDYCIALNYKILNDDNISFNTIYQIDNTYDNFQGGNIKEFINNFLKQFNINPFLDSYSVLYADGSLNENEFTCLYTKIGSDERPTLFEIKYIDNNYQVYSPVYSNLNDKIIGFVIAYEYFNKLRNDEIFKHLKSFNQINSLNIYNFLYLIKPFYNTNVPKINNIKILNIRNDIVLLEINKDHIYYRFEVDNVIGFNNHKKISPDVFKNGLIYIYDHIIDDLDNLSFNQELDYKQYNNHDFFKYNYDYRKFYTRFDYYDYPLLSLEKLDKYSNFELDDLKEKYFIFLIESLQEDLYYPGICKLIPEFKELYCKFFSKISYINCQELFKYLDLDEEETMRFIDNCNNNPFYEIDDESLTKYYFSNLDYSLDFVINNIDYFALDGKYFILNNISASWRSDKDMIKKLEMFLKLSGISIK